MLLNSQLCPSKGWQGIGLPICPPIYPLALWWPSPLWSQRPCNLILMLTSFYGPKYKKKAIITKVAPHWFFGPHGRTGRPTAKWPVSMDSLESWLSIATGLSPIGPPMAAQDPEFGDHPGGQFHFYYISGTLRPSSSANCGPNFDCFTVLEWDWPVDCIDGSPESRSRLFSRSVPTFPPYFIVETWVKHIWPPFPYLWSEFNKNWYAASWGYGLPRVQTVSPNSKIVT